MASILPLVGGEVQPGGALKRLHFSTNYCTIRYKDKRTPHHGLATVQDLIRQGHYRVTKVALDQAMSDFGLVGASKLAECVLALTRSHFQKSTTAYKDHRQWMDVFKTRINGVDAYLKLMIEVDATTRAMTVILSFKEWEQ